MSKSLKQVFNKTVAFLNDGPRFFCRGKTSEKARILSAIFSAPFRWQSGGGCISGNRFFLSPCLFSRGSWKYQKQGRFRNTVKHLYIWQNAFWMSASIFPHHGASRDTTEKTEHSDKAILRLVYFQSLKTSSKAWFIACSKLFSSTEKMYDSSQLSYSFFFFLRFSRSLALSSLIFSLPPQETLLFAGFGSRAVLGARLLAASISILPQKGFLREKNRPDASRHNNPGFCANSIHRGSFFRHSFLTLSFRLHQHRFDAALFFLFPSMWSIVLLVAGSSFSQNALATSRLTRKCFACPFWHRLTRK